MSGHHDDEHAEERALHERLRRALPTEVPADVRRRHLAATNAALGTRRREPLGWWRRRLVAVGAAFATVIAPIGVGIAAAGTLPGDALYPVKRITERVLVLADDDLVAKHRVAELEGLLRTDAEPTRLVPAVEEAGSEVATRDDDGLLDRFVVAAAEVRRRVGDEALALDHLPRSLRERIIDPTPPTSGEDTTDRPSPRPTPTHTPTDPRPTATPTTERPSPSPTPTETSRPADDVERRERHRAGDAGTVVVEVLRGGGIRLGEVHPEAAWDWTPDRRGEPRQFTVSFDSANGQVMFEARYRDGGIVEVRVRDSTADDGTGR